jgi:replicative DNA helicase
MLDLQKLTLRRLLETHDSDLYSKLVSRYFTGNNLEIYVKIERFYKENLRLPTIEEFNSMRMEPSISDYFQSQILSEENQSENIENKFLLAQLQDYAIREETIAFVDKLLNDLEQLEKSEIIDNFQNHLLELNKTIPISDELKDVGQLDIAPKEDSFVMYRSGLSPAYDSTNGGFALQELVGIGGRRGSGKSILALNCAIARYLEGHTVPFFSIEMRYLEVYYRTLSILSEVPFLKFMKNELTYEDKIKVAKKKIEYFYKYINPNTGEIQCSDQQYEQITTWLKELEADGSLLKFDQKIKLNKPELKDNRFFIVDDPALTLNRIDHLCNLFHSKYPKFTMAVVDYLNIVRVQDNKDWKIQIEVAEYLKGFARKFNITMLTPYQVDATLEARFAKGILDSFDRAFTFAPSDPTNPETEHLLRLFTAKIRNGKNLTFDIGMNWDCVKIDNSKLGLKPSGPITERLHNGAQYGTGTKEGGGEQARDVS